MRVGALAAADGAGSRPSPSRREVGACITRTVRDSAAVLAATVSPEHPFEPVTGPSMRRLRIALYRRTLFGELPAPEVAAALDAGADALRALGHSVVEVEGPTVDAPAISGAFFLLGGFGVAAAASYAPPHLVEAGLEPFSLALMRRSLAAAPEALTPAVAAMHAAGRAFVDWISAWDAALCPTMPDLPPLLGHLAPTLDPDLLIRRTERVAGYTAIHNMAGVPAMSVPLGMAGDLPVGLHFAAGPGEDARLLALAFELEAAYPWVGRRPPIRA